MQPLAPPQRPQYVPSSCRAPRRETESEWVRKSRSPCGPESRSYSTDSKFYCQNWRPDIKPHTARPVTGGTCTPRFRRDAAQLRGGADTRAPRRGREGYSSFPTDEFFQLLEHALMPAALDLPRLPRLAQDVLVRLPFPLLAQILDFELALLLRRRRVRRLPRLRLGVGHRVRCGRRAHAQLRDLRYLRGRPRASAVARTLRTFDETCSTVSTSMKSTLQQYCSSAPGLGRTPSTAERAPGPPLGANRRPKTLKPQGL